MHHLIAPREGARRTPQEQEQVKQLWLTCKNGNEAEAAQLLNAGVSSNVLLYYEDPLDEEGCDKSTCLHYAASAGHLGIVNLLLAHDAYINPRDQNGWIPLIGALARGQVPVVRRLIAMGAHINAVDDLLGHRPIATPVQCLNPQLVRTLLQAGAAVTPPPMTWHNNVPLHHIYQGHALHILCERLQRKPDYAPEYDAQETEDRALEIIEIVRAHGNYMSHQDSDGNTVYHAAARLNNKRILAALMVNTKYTKDFRLAARAQLKTVLLINQRHGNNSENDLPALPREIILRIFSHMPIECVQTGSENLAKLLMPHYASVSSMRRQYLDACLLDLKKHSCHTSDETLNLRKILGIVNKDQQQACDIIQDATLKEVLNPLNWH